MLQLITSLRLSFKYHEFSNKKKHGDYELFLCFLMVVVGVDQAKSFGWDWAVMSAKDEFHKKF